MNASAAQARDRAVGRPSSTRPHRVEAWVMAVYAFGKVAVSLLLCSFVLLSTGCNTGTLDTTWAAHQFPNKTSSPNGLAYLEKLCMQKGTRFKAVNRLSPRLERSDCLILLGNTFHPPAKEARDWMEKWLAEKSGRLIIYFGRDFDAAEYYLQQTLDQQPDAKRKRASFDLAIARAQRDDLLYQQIDDDYFCRWFYLRITEPERVLEKFEGPWSKQLTGNLKWPVRSFLDVADQDLRDEEPDWNKVANANPTFRLPRFLRKGRRTVPAPPVQPNATGTRSVYTSIWGPSDIGNSEQWEREWDLAPDAEALLVGDDGTPLITRLTSDRYPDSHILILANGAPVFNGMMVEPDWRSLCMNIANAIGEDKRVALLPYTEFGIQVSEVPDQEEDVAGLSVLMTWPLNFLMAHLAFLGIIICIALFPILGRPQTPKSSNVSDFGQHAEATGRMLQGTRDLPYALRLVADYLRIVRGETLPTWLESELARSTANAPPTGLPAQATVQTPSPPSLPPPSEKRPDPPPT